MIKQLLVVCALLIANSVFCQTIPNGGFENWSTSTYEEPDYYQTSNAQNGSGVSNPSNAVKTTDAYHGLYAIKLTTILAGTDTAFAYFSNGDPGKSPPQGGLPYSQKPTGFRCYYKSNIVGTDSAIILVMFKKAGVSIGSYFYKIGKTKTAYMLFNPVFSPALTTTPDSIVFAAASSNAFIGSGIPGNMLQLDSISLTGVTQQPANFNGDLELWQTHTINSLNGWSTSGGNNGAGQTMDKYTGSYAMELQTTGPSFGGSNQVQPGSAITGVQVNNSSPKGGHPYTKQIDTLIFYYKYIPADPNDSASVYISFSKGGNSFAQYGKFLGTAVGSYKKVVIPFNLNQVPDTAMISIQSSSGPSWPYPNSYVGSDLKIDNMYLASQTLPVTNFYLLATGCIGQAIQLLDSSSNMVTAWQWVMGGGNPANSNLENPTVSYNTLGSHTVSMIATNSFGSGIQVFKHITIYALPVISATSPIVCEGNHATITANGANTYTWSTSATTASILVTPTVTTTYTVTGTDANGCSDSAIASVKVLTPPTPNICMVTVDSLSINNIIYWDKTPYTNVDSFIIYRELSTNIYARIGAQPFSVLSQFIDTARSIGGTSQGNGNPNGGTYRYKLQTVDTCGNYSALSPYHNTIYIQQGTNGAFSWTTNYLIEGQTAPPISNYVLSCDTANTGSWVVVQGTSGSQQTIVDPGFSHHANVANWRVDALGFNCNPTQRFASGTNNTLAVKVKSHSNQSNNRTAGIKQASGNSQVIIYPNPAANVVNIGFAKATTKVSVKIISLLGSEILNQTYNQAGTNLSLDISKYESGAYLMQITTDNFTEIKRIVKQ
jgi:hypothetical protein